MKIDNQYNHLTQKFVAVVNKDLEIGVAMNALAHTSLAMGSLLGDDKCFLKKYTDANHNQWDISGRSYIILRAKSIEIKKAFLKAKALNIKHVVFIDSMTGGTYLDQLEKMHKRNQDEHIYYAAVLFGEKEELDPITKKFSLYTARQ